MNQMEQNLLQAIRKSLWNNDTVFPSDIVWNSVLEEAEKQSVLEIAANVAPAEIQRDWNHKISAATAHFIRVLHYQSTLCDLFKTNNIRMVILKGTAAAIYYPVPSQRSAGDIDFLVSEESFDRAKTLLIENGYRIHEDRDYSRHVTAVKDGMIFELHRYFAEKDGMQLDSIIQDGLCKAEVGCIYDSCFPMLPEVENGLVLLAHMAHHLKADLGLRQVLDWMMFVKKKLDDSAWKNGFQSFAEQTGLDVLAVTATRMCQVYLGLSERIAWCKDADPVLCDKLMEMLLSSGNFGKKRGSGMKIEGTVSRLRNRGFRFLQEEGERNWEAYHKHRWLKPFAWAYQIGRYIRQGLKTKRSAGQIREDFDRGKQRSDLLKKLKLGE